MTRWTARMNLGLADCGAQLYADYLHLVEEVVARKEMPVPILMYACFTIYWVLILLYHRRICEYTFTAFVGFTGFWPKDYIRIKVWAAPGLLNHPEDADQ